MVVAAIARRVLAAHLLLAVVWVAALPLTTGPASATFGDGTDPTNPLASGRFVRLVQGDSKGGRWTPEDTIRWADAQDDAGNVAVFNITCETLLAGYNPPQSSLLTTPTPYNYSGASSPSAPKT